MRFNILFIFFISYRALAIEQDILLHLEKNEPTVVFTDPLKREVDPIRSGSMQSIWISRLLHSAPFYIADDGKLRSQLLDYYDYDRIQGLITLELSDVAFSDGTKIEAKDLAYSILRVGLINELHEFVDSIEGYSKWKSTNDKFNTLPEGVTVKNNRLSIKLTSDLRNLFNALVSFDFSVVPHQFLNQETFFIEGDAPTSGMFKLDICSTQIYKFKNPKTNEQISMISISKKDIEEIMPHLRENHTLQVEELSCEPSILKIMKQEFSSFANINKRIYGIVLDSNVPPSIIKE